MVFQRVGWGQGIPDGGLSLGTWVQLESTEQGEYEQGVGGANASKLGCGCSGVALDGPEEERKGEGPVSRSQERRDCLQVQGLEPRPKPGQVGKPDQRHN